MTVKFSVNTSYNEHHHRCLFQWTEKVSLMFEGPILHIPAAEKQSV